MDQAQAAELVRSIFRDIIDAGRFEYYDHYFAPDFVDHASVGDVRGKAAFEEYINGFRAAIPDMRHDVSDVTLLDETTAVWLVHVTATFTGEFMGVRGAGQKVDLVTINAGRLRDGLAVEHWGPGPDGLVQLMTQLGLAAPVSVS